MKTETQIAKENIKKWKGATEDKYIRMYYYACEKDKEKDQRFLEFLEEREKCSTNLCHICLREVREKITDLKQAIKLYEDAGI